MPVVVDDHHHVRRHEALGHALRRGDQPRVVETGADVAVVGGDVAARVHAAAGFDDVGAHLFFDAGAHSASEIFLRHSSEQK